ncbi:MAG: class I SAM-dependent methyltransferase [Chloroflexota bacterium]
MTETDGPIAPAPCCAPDADPRVACRFDREYGDWDDAEGFPEIVEVSARLLDALRDAPIVRPTVLEIGCGTGGVSVALAEMGATHVRGVDLSLASVEVARRRAAAIGVEGRSSFEVGEGSAVGLIEYDWVVADRVLCCDAHLDRMVDALIGAARDRIALSVPESRGWRGLLNRPMWAAENVWDLLHGGCRGYVHDVRRIERRLGEAGYRSMRAGHVDLWHFAVYTR